MNDQGNIQDNLRKISEAAKEVLLQMRPLQLALEQMNPGESEWENELFVETLCLLAQDYEVPLKDLLRSIQDTNSQMPVTRDFLRSRGFEHISELDAEGIEELGKHLEQTLADPAS